MTKIQFFAEALLIMAGVASCKKNSDVQEPESQGAMVAFEVTAGQGGTNTSMVGGVLSWTAGDKITVLETSGAHSTLLNLKAGAGTASGTFNGKISADVQDKADLYGLYNATYSSGNFTVSVPASQTYNATSFQEGIFPSIGTATYNKSGSTAISFQNPMGILRLNLKGSASVKSVKITAASGNIAGDFTVTPALEVSGGTGKEVTITCPEAVTITSGGVYFNFVTAPFTSQTVSVLVTKSDDTTFSTDITVAVSASCATKQDVVLPDKPATKGKASVSASAGIVKDEVEWVQLWKDGPRWAAFSVGAKSVSEYSGYYCWGGTKDNDPESWYSSATTDIQGTTDDTALNLWGSNWQMATKNDFDSLRANCTAEWKDAGAYCLVAGMLYTGKGDYSNNSVFFPAGGYYDDNQLYDRGTIGFYWTTIPGEESKASVFYFNGDTSIEINSMPRKYKGAVCAILKE